MEQILWYRGNSIIINTYENTKIEIIQHRERKRDLRVHWSYIHYIIRILAKKCSNVIESMETVKVPVAISS